MQRDKKNKKQFSGIFCSTFFVTKCSLNRSGTTPPEKSARTSNQSTNQSRHSFNRKRTSCPRISQNTQFHYQPTSFLPVHAFTFPFTWYSKETTTLNPKHTPFHTSTRNFEFKALGQLTRLTLNFSNKYRRQQTTNRLRPCIHNYINKQLRRSRVHTCVYTVVLRNDSQNSATKNKNTTP
jgi:hypothetical protein